MSQVIDGLARQMKSEAWGLTVKVQIPLSRNIVEQQQNFMKKSCVVLITLDANSDLNELAIIIRDRLEEVQAPLCTRTD